MRLAVTIATLTVAGCGGPAPHPTYSPQTTAALVEVKAPPPPARVEEVPARPRPDALWIDGEWSWRRGRWSWVPGRWLVPVPGATFSPWASVRGPDGRIWFAPGVWKDDDGGVIDPPPTPIKEAITDTGEVVNASGEAERIGRTLRTGLRGPPGDAGAGGRAMTIEDAGATGNRMVPMDAGPSGDAGGR